MRLKSLNRVHYIKEDDTFTPIQLQVIGYDNKPFDLSEAEEIVVKIGISDGMLAQKKLSDGTLTRMEVTGGLEFRLDVDDQLVRGANFIEVQGTINSKKFKAPSKGYYKLNIEKSMDSIGQAVTKITLDYFMEKVDERIAQIQSEIDLLHDTREYFETHLDETVDLAVDNKMTPFVEDVNEHLAGKVTLASYQPIKKVRYIAHRGMRAIAPENTIPAYELAGELGMWGAECDVTTTKDGAWVLMHDNTVDRTTNGTGYVSDFTLDEIKNLKIDAGNNVELYPNLRVPTLEEYLITCKKYGLVPVIEIKSASKNSDYDTFVNLIKKYGYEENCIVISFSLTALQEVRLRSKKIVMQYLADISETTINQVRELRNAGLDVNHTLLTKEKIELAHSEGIMVNAWTVNDPQIAKNLTDLGVDYITNDVLIEVI